MMVRLQSLSLLLLRRQHQARKVRVLRGVHPGPAFALRQYPASSM